MLGGLLLGLGVLVLGTFCVCFFLAGGGSSKRSTVKVDVMKRKEVVDVEVECKPNINTTIKFQSTNKQI